MPIREPTDLTVGMTVYLYPTLKTSSRNVHRMLAVQVMKDPKRHWPIVVVSWEEDGKLEWELVHKDNIRIRPVSRVAADKREGDTTREHGKGPSVSRVRVMPGKPKEITMPDGMEQGELF